jgi:hypothetical protein
MKMLKDGKQKTQKAPFKNISCPQPHLFFVRQLKFSISPEIVY